MTAPPVEFDLEAFKRAFVGKDVCSGRVSVKGIREVSDFIARIGASDVELTIEDEVVGPDRAAFCLWCTLRDGRRIIEHVITSIKTARSRGR